MVVINLIVGGYDSADLSNPESKDGPDAGVGGQGGEEAQQACHQHADHHTGQFYQDYKTAFQKRRMLAQKNILNIFIDKQTCIQAPSSFRTSRPSAPQAPEFLKLLLRDEKCTWKTT